jgi:thiol-disulfide isomerase/thioredoxin
MRSVCVFLVALLVTGCSSTSGLQTSEQSFISGNGIVTLIDKSDRDLAPIFAGPLLDGGNFNFAPGKVTVLNVWASWCSPCRAEAPSLEELSIKYPEVQFVGVLTRDNLVAARAFVKRFSITYPTIIDDAILAEFSGLLSVNAIPTTLVIDRSGRLAARISGEITFSSMTELLDRITSE